MRAPLAYYRNNTVNSLSLIEACVAAGIGGLVFSSTAAVYGNPAAVPVAEDAPTAPLSPYGHSKLMTEQLLRDAGAAHPLRHVILRYFNVAGADPAGRAGPAAAGATHLLKVACEAALGRRASVPLYGDDYPTRDGTCVRDFIHVSDLADRPSQGARASAGGRRQLHPATAATAAASRCARCSTWWPRSAAARW